VDLGKVKGLVEDTTKDTDRLLRQVVPRKPRDTPKPKATKTTDSGLLSDLLKPKH
jgi:hypothetical protein